jgi:hypothetical protein
MEMLLAILMGLVLMAGAWVCGRADNWAERFVQLLAFVMAGLGVFAVAWLLYLQLSALGSAQQFQPGSAQLGVNQSWLGVLGLFGGGLAGAVFSYWFHLRPKERASMIIDLLRGAMRVQALEEAWIVEAIDNDGKPSEALARQAVLTRDETLPEGEPANGNGCYLRRVEVRGVLDSPKWCCTVADPFYARLGARRAWIVRERLLSTDVGRDHRPALVSSAAIEELVAWMEQVAAARKGKLLTDDGAKALWAPLLFRVVKADILDYVSETPRRLSPRARKTLDELGRKLARDMGNPG